MNRFALRGRPGVRRLLPLSSIALVIFIGCGERHSHTTTESESHPAQAAASTRLDADNSRSNERDRGATATPFDQGNSQSDLDTTQAIRKAVVGDDRLSTNAKNVKIITAEGTVTLRGPVNSESERQIVLATAQRAAGPRQVVNQLDIAQ